MSFLFPSLSSRAQSLMLFHIQSYTLNIRTRKRGVLRALRQSNFTSILCSCQVWAFRTTCPYLICGLFPLVWTCYQLEPGKPLFWECLTSDTPRLLLIADRIWDGVWQPPANMLSLPIGRRLPTPGCRWPQIMALLPWFLVAQPERSQLVAPWQQRW